MSSLLDKLDKSPASLEEARGDLHAWIEDLEALRSHVDPTNPDARDFNAAWTAALAKAKAAAARYAKAVDEEP